MSSAPKDMASVTRKTHIPTRPVVGSSSVTLWSMRPGHLTMVAWPEDAADLLHVVRFRTPVRRGAARRRLIQAAARGAGDCAGRRSLPVRGYLVTDRPGPYVLGHEPCCFATPLSD